MTFIKGHPDYMKGKRKPMSEEQKQKLSLAHKGKPSWRKGKTMSESSRLKMSLAHKGKPSPKLGKPLSGETKHKISLSTIGKRIGKNNPFYEKHLSIESKCQISKSLKGVKNPNYGKNHSGINNPHYGKRNSKETLLKMSLIKIGKYRGELGGNWLGGKSSESYPPEFNHILKDTIRERDGYLCQLCHIGQNGHRLDIHHIDYNKNNLNTKNLISLCKKCHTKTNHNREYYTEYFNQLLNLNSGIAIC